MSMNLRNSFEIAWENSGRSGTCEYAIPQLDTETSIYIYGDGTHEGICKRLEEYYREWTKECVEFDARIKGVKDPWKSKDHAYYEKVLEDELKDSWYMNNLERLKALDGSQITWEIV